MISPIGEPQSYTTRSMNIKFKLMNNRILGASHYTQRVVINKANETMVREFFFGLRGLIRGILITVILPQFDSAVPSSRLLIMHAAASKKRNVEWHY